MGRSARADFDMALDFLAAKVPEDAHFFEDEADEWGWSEEEREDDANRTQIMVGWTRVEAKVARELLARHGRREQEVTS